VADDEGDAAETVAAVVGVIVCDTVAVADAHSVSEPVADCDMTEAVTESEGDREPVIDSEGVAEGDAVRHRVTVGEGEFECETDPVDDDCSDAEKDVQPEDDRVDVTLSEVLDVGEVDGEKDAVADAPPDGDTVDDPPSDAVPDTVDDEQRETEGVELPQRETLAVGVKEGETVPLRVDASETVTLTDVVTVAEASDGRASVMEGDGEGDDVGE